jgi:hypothetical protein
MEDIKGIIYLIQPAELVGTRRYKIGCSSKTTLDRCKNGYKKGSRFLNIMECCDPFGLEKRIKEAFGTQFTLVAGKEYFEGDEEEIKRVFYEVVSGGDGSAASSKVKTVKKRMESSEPIRVKKCPHGSMSIKCSMRWKYDDLFQLTEYVKNEDVGMFKLIYGNKPCGYHTQSCWSKPKYHKFYLDCVKNFTQGEVEIVKKYCKESVDDFIGTDFEKAVVDCYKYVLEELGRHGVEPENGCVNICLDGVVFCIKVCGDKSIKYIESYGKCCEFAWG